MAGQRSSSSSFTYDVFISFRQQEFRDAFTGALVKALRDRGIRTFIEDEELHRGDEITPALVKAIKESRIAIILFSKSYVASSHCLEVLAYIVDYFQGNHQFIFPVFYRVDPDDIKQQSGNYGEELARHEEKFKDNKENVQKWRNALLQVANLSGLHFKYGIDGYEFQFIQRIVEEVSTRIVEEVEEVSRTLNQTSQSVPGVLQTSQRVFQAETTWRLVGLVSSVVGLSCYALSPSCIRLIRGWNSFKFFLYGVLSLVIFTIIVFAKQSSRSTKHTKLKTYICFAVLMIISVYSFFYDNAVNGKPDILSVVSNAAFALVSLCLSKLIKFGFETGVFCYFLSCLAVQLWTINWKLILVAIIFSLPLFVEHFSSDSQPEVASGGQVIQSSSDSRPEVDSGGQRVIHIQT